MKGFGSCKELIVEDPYLYYICIYSNVYLNCQALVLVPVPIHGEIKKYKYLFRRN